MAVVAVPFILYLVRFCSSKSCKTTYYLLPTTTTYYLLPTTYYLLPTTVPTAVPTAVPTTVPTTCYLLPTTYYEYLLPTTSTYYLLPTYYLLYEYLLLYLYYLLSNVPTVPTVPTTSIAWEGAPDRVEQHNIDTKIIPYTGLSGFSNAYTPVRWRPDGTKMEQGLIVHSTSTNLRGVNRLYCISYEKNECVREPVQLKPIT